MATVYLIFALIISVLAVIFALQNSMTVTISLLAWEVTASLSRVILITLAIGALIGYLVLVPSVIKKSLAVSNSRKRIGALEKELDEKKARITELEMPKPAPTLPEHLVPGSLPTTSAEIPQPKL